MTTRFFCFVLKKREKVPENLGRVPEILLSILEVIFPFDAQNFLGVGYEPFFLFLAKGLIHECDCCGFEA